MASKEFERGAAYAKSLLTTGSTNEIIQQYRNSVCDCDFGGKTDFDRGFQPPIEAWAKEHNVELSYEDSSVFN
jgi:hypothetical protein